MTLLIPAPLSPASRSRSSAASTILSFGVGARSPPERTTILRPPLPIGEYRACDMGAILYRLVYLSRIKHLDWAIYMAVTAHALANDARQAFARPRATPSG